MEIMLTLFRLLRFLLTLSSSQSFFHVTAATKVNLNHRVDDKQPAAQICWSLCWLQSGQLNYHLILASSSTCDRAQRCLLVSASCRVRKNDLLVQLPLRFDRHLCGIARGIGFCRTSHLHAAESKIATQAFAMQSPWRMHHLSFFFQGVSFPRSFGAMGHPAHVSPAPTKLSWQSFVFPVGRPCSRRVSCSACVSFPLERHLETGSFCSPVQWCGGCNAFLVFVD